MVEAVLDFGETSHGLGVWTDKFEQALAKFLGVKYAAMVNSGSSANLVAVSAFAKSGGGNIAPGSEVITPAVTFPTAINPILQNGFIPVVIDVQLGSYHVTLDSIKAAISPKTRMLFIPHLLNASSDMEEIREYAETKGLVLIEDTCDALGCRFNGKFAGTFGHCGTFSFYSNHHITSGGEGGAIVTNDQELLARCRSIRDWGRERPGRFRYPNMGFNLKPTEVQSACGLAQLEKLPHLMKIRKRNFQLLHESFSKFVDFFLLPSSTSNADSCWFTFPLTISPKAPFSRDELILWYDRHNIEARTFWAGNILTQPAYSGANYRVAEPLVNSTLITERSFFIGLHPGLSEDQLRYVIRTTESFLRLANEPRRVSLSAN